MISELRLVTLAELNRSIKKTESLQKALESREKALIKIIRMPESDGIKMRKIAAREMSE